MPRVKRGTVGRKRHKKVLKLSKGYYGAKSKLFRPANQQVLKSLSYSYDHRKKRKGDFRKLWIARINAAARMNGLSYNSFIYGLKQAGIDVNRKMLADLAVNDAEAFSELANIAKSKIQA